MNITQANVGQIFFIGQNRECVQIEAVTENRVIYRTENGYDNTVDRQRLTGVLVRDRDRIREFNRNAALGEMMLAVEKSCLRKLLCQRTCREETETIFRLLDDSIRIQNHLDERISGKRG